MKTEKEIRDELGKLYKGREWRKKNYWAADMGTILDGKLVSSKQMRIEFERAEERIETLEWVLAQSCEPKPFKVDLKLTSHEVAGVKVVDFPDEL